MRYFDHNATVPLHPDARAAWLAAVDHHWHNPSGLYAAATAASELLEESRERLADLLGASPGRIVFTAGATEANNALARHLGRTASPRARALLSGIEHPCVADAFHAALAGRVAELPVDRDGVVDPEVVDAALAESRAEIAIVSVVAAGNESGVLQPWVKIAAVCRRFDVPFHTDAAQWLGKLPAHGLAACDWVTGSGHKFGGPRGVGFLVVPEGERSFHGDLGGPQEAGRRAGTENVAAIVAMVAALAARDAESDAVRTARAADRDAAAARLTGLVPQAVVVSGTAPRLWNTLAVIVPGADARRVVAELAAAGFEASTGSACSAGAGSTARVVAAIGPEALGVAEVDLRGLVRLSGGWETTAADWLAAVEAFAAAVRRAESSRPRIVL